jgi:3-isopropylmalate dehydrogenase
LKAEVARGVNFIFVRELCGGIYFGEKKECSSVGHADETSYDVELYSTGEIQRVARIACLLARDYAKLNGTAKPKLTSIDKANVLASSRHWRSVVSAVVTNEFPDVELSHLYVDAASMHLIKNPRDFNGVVLTNNIFGDILSDESSIIPGSLGLLPSASLSSYPGYESANGIGLYEPIHGSAPDIAGKTIANPVGAILSMAMLIRYSLGWEEEAKAVEDAVRMTLDAPKAGGFGFRTKDLGGDVSTTKFGDKVCELLREKLGFLISKEYDLSFFQPKPVEISKKHTGLNVVEKILLQHLSGGSREDIKVGETICVKVDWTLASELTWKGMEKTYNEMGRPAIWRNDRFWLAIDHTVDPSINHLTKPRELISASTKFAAEAKIKDFYGPNQTILHTDFYRYRSQPGMIVIGADSHTCSAGGLGALAVGLGAADVVMPLVTGYTWFKVPETVRINFVGKPPRGIGGKDAILWILGELKRNTVAFERAVEFGGPGSKYLSCDARFAIANMATEFGGIAGVYEADEQTAAYIAKRKDHNDEAMFFKPDPDASYADCYEIDLSKVDSMVALYPNPDNVVPVTQVEGMNLDGVFIGACTTAEEDLVLAALVLEAGLKKGLVACIGGKRKVTPGSVTIMAKLKQHKLTEIYEKAGFEIGAPGCSYCLGIAADKAGEGEVWLSSQNRNFKNRMGKGSFGNLASASTAAASSFDMKIRNPQELLAEVDWEKFNSIMNVSEKDIESAKKNMKVCEPEVNNDVSTSSNLPSPPPPMSSVIEGKVQKFGDHVDTDAIIPAEFMPGVSDEDLGTHCFQYVRPGFRELASQGFSIVVAGSGFGSGSSREEAPRALKGCGIQAVIAKSYAFIYGRNQANMALLGITPENFDEFYALVQEGSDVRIDVSARLVSVIDNNGSAIKSFAFTLSEMEERIISGGGVCQLYQDFDKSLFQVLMQKDSNASTSTASSKVVTKISEAGKAPTTKAIKMKDVAHDDAKCATSGCEKPAW